MLRKLIKNSPEEPWLTMIKEKKKTYEGRLNQGVWSGLKIGDIIIFHDKDGNEVTVKITILRYFQNFTVAYDYLGKNLIPMNNIKRDDIEDLYLRYYSKEDIQKYGIIAIGITPI